MVEQQRIAAIVLAAGTSSRMGSDNKLLKEINGSPMIAITVSRVVASGITNIVVVTGHEAKQVEAALAAFSVKFAYNDQFTTGISTSILCGIFELGGEVDGALIVLGDMPLVGPSEIMALTREFENTRDICVPLCRRKRGNPVLWGRDYFQELLELTGDKGARDILLRHSGKVTEVSMDNEAILQDFDRIEDLENPKIGG